MGRVVFAYVVFMLVLFLMLTVAASMKIALWTFSFIHAACALGACVSVWREQRMWRLTRMERG